MKFSKTSLKYLCILSIIVLSIPVAADNVKSTNNLEIKDFRISDKLTASGKATVSVNSKVIAIDLSELTKSFEMTEGEFGYGDLKSSDGCPIISYVCYCENEEETRNLTLHFSMLKDSLELKVFDPYSKKTLSKKYANVKMSQLNQIPQAKDTKQKDNISVVKNFAKIKDALRQILPGGVWELDTLHLYKDYQATVNWQCRFDKNKNELCFCNEPSQDNPTCSNYVRKISFGISYNENSKIIQYEPFDINFEDFTKLKINSSYTVGIR